MQITKHDKQEHFLYISHLTIKYKRKFNPFKNSKIVVVVMTDFGPSQPAIQRVPWFLAEDKAVGA
jgi:hypothetical protein